jgi:hypothetical protein
MVYILSQTNTTYSVTSYSLSSYTRLTISETHEGNCHPVTFITFLDKKKKKVAKYLVTLILQSFLRHSLDTTYLGHILIFVLFHDALQLLRLHSVKWWMISIRSSTVLLKLEHTELQCHSDTLSSY